MPSGQGVLHSLTRYFVADFGDTLSLCEPQASPRAYKYTDLRISEFAGDRGLMATFGNLISEARKAKSLSQKELALQIMKEDGSAISPQYLNDLEHDRRGAPSEQLINEFALVLEIDRDLLYYSAGEVSPDLRGLDPAEGHVQEAIAAFRRTLEKGDGS